MGRYFELTWSDLIFEKQEEMIEAVKEDWIEAYKTEGKEELESLQVNRSGMTNKDFWTKWKNEHQATDEQMILIALNELYGWEDIEEDTEFNEQFYQFLNSDLEDVAENKAEEACYQGIRHMEIEVETV